MLEPDVRLVEIHHANHPAAAARALDAVHFVERASDLRVADVNCVGAFHFLQFFLLELVEEKALARRAAIHFHSGEVYFHHG